MPYPVDPTGLEGDELDRWYRRSQQTIEQERQTAADRQYKLFFGGRDAPDPHSFQSVGARSDGTEGGESDVLWIANGAGRYRALRPGAPDYQAALQPVPVEPNDLPESPAAPEETYLVEVGNAHNPRLRREWVRNNGSPWPKTDDGRNYHVAHRRAIADGGTNTLDNIEPMHPDEHLAQHLSNGDAARWGRRAGIAKTFGGRVEPPAPGPRPPTAELPRVRTPRLNGFGLLDILSHILGMQSGRIRTDTPVHAWFDMAGVPAPGDDDQMVDPSCRSMGITTPGAKCA